MATMLRDPLAPAEQDLVRSRLRSVYQGVLGNKMDIVDLHLAGCTVLDVGVVEHTLDYADRATWKHGYVLSRAARAVGIDVLDGPIEELRRRGYDVRNVDATSDATLDERFDAVFVGDVIEHVTDVPALLRFATRHLQPGGSAFFTTPCPFWWKDLVSTARRWNVPNVDHVAWITPPQILELCRREGLHLSGFWLLQSLGGRRVTRLLQGARSYLFRDSEIFSWAYVYRITSR